MDKKPMIILAGPTASGKTSLSIALAKKTGAEVISADSMQVYRGMDIGTAKVTPQEMDWVPHHLIDCLDPKEPFDVFTFQSLARQAAGQIYGRGHIPLVVGGTGFYIQALLRDIDFTDSGQDSSYRRNLEAEAAAGGGARLYQLLQQLDPQAAEAIHPNNSKRVIRALEFYHLTGRRISAHNQEEKQRPSPYNFAYFVLSMPRPLLYSRIELRVDRMFDDGLVDEVKRLQDMGCRRGMVSMQGLGYKEVLDYLDGNMSLEQTKDIIKRDTRRFAKRQLTWFRREKDAVWLDRTAYSSQQALLDEVLRVLKEKNIIK